MERHVIKKAAGWRRLYLRKHLKIDKQWCHLWAVRIVGNINFCMFQSYTVIIRWKRRPSIFQSFSMWFCLLFTVWLCFISSHRCVHNSNVFWYICVFIHFQISKFYVHISRKKLHFLLAMKKNTSYKVMWWLYKYATIPYTGCHRRNGPNFGRVFLMLNYTDITQNTYIRSWTVTEIMAREKCGHLAFPRSVRLQLCSALTVRLWRHKLRPTR